MLCMPVMWVTPASPAETQLWDAGSTTALDTARDSPCLLGSGLGAQRVPSPPAAAWPGQQPLPGQAPCSLMADMSSPVRSLGWNRGKTISAQNYSTPVRLFSSLKYYMQDVATSTLSLWTGQFLSRCLCSVGSLSNVVATVISTSERLKNPQSIASNNESKQHQMQSKTLHPFFPKWETNQTQNARILRQTCSKIQQSLHLPLWPASQPWQFARRGSRFPLRTGHAASRPSRWQAVPCLSPCRIF